MIAYTPLTFRDLCPALGSPVTRVNIVHQCSNEVIHSTAKLGLGTRLWLKGHFSECVTAG